MLYKPVGFEFYRTRLGTITEQFYPSGVAGTCRVKIIFEYIVYK